MEPIAVILLVVWGILNIILFFKIWGATNDIAEMRNMMHSYTTPQIEDKIASSVPSTEEQEVKDTEDVVQPNMMENLNLKAGDYVIRNIDNKEYKIEEICPDGVLIYVGMFTGYQVLKPNEFTIKK